MNEPAFIKIIEDLLENPDKIAASINTDNRVKLVWDVLVGVACDPKSEKPNDEELQKIKDVEEKQKKAKEKERLEEMIRIAKEEEERIKKLSPEERQAIWDKNLSEKIKQEGNNLFKNKNYQEALQKYDEAWSIYQDFNIKLNVCNVLIAIEKYRECIVEADKILESTSDCVQRSKAHAKKGAALERLGSLEAAIKSYEDSLLESNDSRVKEMLVNCRKDLIRKEKVQVLDQEKAELHYLKAKELFRNCIYDESL